VQPTFLFCLGATKAGTSWLYQHLLAHPECHLRTIKELHYFNMAVPRGFDAALKSNAHHIDVMAHRLSNAPAERQAIVGRRLADLQDWRAVLQKRDIDLPAYRDFLTKDLGAAKLVADMTPAYSLMSVQALAALVTVAADSRFVYLIRDPLARLWSHVRMVAARDYASYDFEKIATAQMEAILSGDMAGEGAGIVQRGDYARILPKLAQAIPANRLFVQFQEEMLTPPGVAKLSAFLGIGAVAAELGERVHEGKALSLRDDLRARAIEWLRPQYEFVASMFPALPAAWRVNMEKGFA
jgi:Sulfotransferase family